MDGLNKTHQHLIYLMSCALHGAAASDDLLDGLDLPGLLVLARDHSVAAMVCMALERTAVFAQADPAVQKQWLDAKNKAIWKNMLLDADRLVLMDAMEHAGIWYMPLKGSILKEWYPQGGMREMSDNDILFDGSRREQVRDFFLRRGYSAEHYGKSNHDVYFKPPVYNFEMHVALFSDSDEEELAEKYAGIRQKLIPDETRKYRLHFTPEDFYIFALTHAYKHYSQRGIGIRTLADIFVMNQRIGASLNWSYVEKELEDLGIQDFESSSRLLSEKIFGEKLISEIALTAQEQDMLLYYMQASTHGNIENGVSNRLHTIQADAEPITGFTKLRYCLARLFPSRKWCKEKYPFVYRHPYLLPVFWVWRWIVIAPARKAKVLRELSALKGSSRKP